MSPRISLEQWRALVAVVEAGGYAQAAARVHKSQSTITYAVQKLESVLGVKVFEIAGRRAKLTATGEVLYRRGKALVDEAGALERVASDLARGWEPELRIAVEIVFPTWLLLQCLATFGQERPDTRIELIESVLGGTDEALLEGRVDLAIASHLPPGFLGDPILLVRFVCAAHPDHPLHHLGRRPTLEDLRQHRHLVIRDSGSTRTRQTGFLGERRWTVSHKATSIRAACLGMGYAWFPLENIRGELERGELKPLPLREGAEREGTLYLVVPEPDRAGPGLKRLIEILRARLGECTGKPLDAPAVQTGVAARRRKS
ncbi:MAG TPA: LysR family transcriptional regulator [Solimonas sp.]|nr:LysR family transcriptional regulator [Solimonas sp.]